MQVGPNAAPQEQPEVPPHVPPKVQVAEVEVEDQEAQPPCY